MSELPISSKYRSTPQEPVTDTERERLTTRLNEAFTAGRLSQDDYTARLDQLYAARQLGELVPVVEALPEQQSYRDPEIVQQNGPPPGELSPSEPSRRFAMVLVGTIAVVVAILVMVLVGVLLF